MCFEMCPDAVVAANINVDSVHSIYNNTQAMHSK